MPNKGERPDESPQQRLFEIMRNPTPEGMWRLGYEYFGHIHDPDMVEGPEDDTLSLKKTAHLTFAPDRLCFLIKSAQDTVRRIAKEISEPIIVCDAGSGLGYLGLAVLALNEELGGRIFFYGVEKNKDTFKASIKVYEYYGVNEKYELLNEDATKLLPGMIRPHILIAEHLCSGLFSTEPLPEVLNAIWTSQNTPFVVVPSGQEVYGRIVHADSWYPYADGIQEKVIRATMNILRGGDDQFSFYQVDGGIVDKAHVDNSIIPATRMGKLSFLELMDQRWDGIVDLRMEAKVKISGTGVLELKAVPVFRDEKSFYALDQENMYIVTLPKREGSNRRMRWGTRLNHWELLKDRAIYTRDWADIIKIAGDGRERVVDILNDTTVCARKFELMRARKYEVSAYGPIRAFMANTDCRRVAF